MGNSNHWRPNPDELLRQVEAEERYGRRGRLKVFLGYASGVGKSFRMFDEGRRRSARGEDVVVAAAQPDMSPEVARLRAQLETIPPRVAGGVACVDVAAVKRRGPALCLIDGLAYRNPPGCANAERWQDVEELLEGGVSVLTTVNLQYIQERQPAVEAIRGRRTEESIPESFLSRADEIEIVDAPPEYCLTASQPGGAEEARQLSQLREIALVLAAEVVDRQLESYLQCHGIGSSFGAQERVLVCVTPRSNAAVMIRRGKRQAERFHGELHVVYVDQGELTGEDGQRLAKNLEMALEAGARVGRLQGEDVVRAILRYAEGHGITQIFVGHSQRDGWLDRVRPDPVERLILEADGMDVRVFPNAGGGE